MQYCVAIEYVEKRPVVERFPGPAEALARLEAAMADPAAWHVYFFTQESRLSRVAIRRSLYRERCTGEWREVTI